MKFQQVFAAMSRARCLRLTLTAFAIRYVPVSRHPAGALEKLGMKETTYGWNLDMQMRAAREGLRILEIPVDHRCRTGGESKSPERCAEPSSRVRGSSDTLPSSRPSALSYLVRAVGK